MSVIYDAIVSLIILCDFELAFIFFYNFSQWQAYFY